MADLLNQTKNRYPMPFCRTEIAVMGLFNGRLSVLLARRAEAPHQGQLALVGGVIRIDLDENLDAAAHRVLAERCGLQLPFLRQICAQGSPTRDARSPWALSVVYRALTLTAELRPVPGKRVSEFVWCPVDVAAADTALAFDHAKLIGQAALATRQEIKDFYFPAGFFPEKFTLGELQHLCEQTLACKLDKVSFRRKLAERDVVEPIEGEMRGGAFRPAQVHKLKTRS